MIVPPYEKLEIGPVAWRAHFESNARVRFLWGPLGTAKSTWLCWRVFFKAKEVSEKYGLSLRAIIVRDTYRNLADSTLKTWFEWFPDKSLMGFVKQAQPVTYMLRTPDGRLHEVNFRHGQTAQDASILLSTEYGLICLEEVAPAYLPGKNQVVSPGISEEFFDMAYSRLRQKGLPEPEIALSANPPSRLHWASKRIIDASGSDKHGRITREYAVDGRSRETTWEHWFTPTSENKKNLREGYYEELTATWPRILVRRFILGERVDIFIGIPRFNLDALDTMLHGKADEGIEPCAYEPPFRGFLRHTDDNILHVKPEANPNGYVKIWQPPKGGHRYVQFFDVAEGLEGGDYSSGHVLDTLDLSIAATWHGHVEPEKLGKEEAPKLGKMYNDALTGIENNNTGGGTATLALKNSGYPRIYYQMNTDTRGRKSERIGWRTDMRTKPILIDGIGDFLDNGGQIVDPDTIQELMTFGVDETGKMQAQEGCFDDRVISFGGALQMVKYGGLEKIFPSLGG